MQRIVLLVRDFLFSFEMAACQSYVLLIFVREGRLPTHSSDLMDILVRSIESVKTRGAYLSCAVNQELACGACACILLKFWSIYFLVGLVLSPSVRRVRSCYLVKIVWPGSAASPMNRLIRGVMLAYMYTCFCR